MPEVLREVRATVIAVVESLSSLVSVPWLDRRLGNWRNEAHVLKWPEPMQRLGRHYSTGHGEKAGRGGDSHQRTRARVGFHVQTLNPDESFTSQHPQLLGETYLICN